MFRVSVSRTAATKEHFPILFYFVCIFIFFFFGMLANPQRFAQRLKALFLLTLIYLNFFFYEYTFSLIHSGYKQREAMCAMGDS